VALRRSLALAVTVLAAALVDVALVVAVQCAQGLQVSGHYGVTASKTLLSRSPGETWTQRESTLRLTDGRATPGWATASASHPPMGMKL